ncbi:unnamed protein product [Linum tenue]|uniref:Uncharacterized protein n=1 Tax=Linum tenue TaxID=586396 RepID=A0AAV0GXU1_9ROSI|nr:unnamed protein product [Linum tenue]
MYLMSRRRLELGLRGSSSRRTDLGRERLPQSLLHLFMPLLLQINLLRRPQMAMAAVVMLHWGIWILRLEKPTPQRLLTFFLGLDAIHDLVTQPPSDPGVSVPCTNEGLAGPQSSSLVQESVDSSEFRSDMATKDPVAVDNDGERLLSEASGGFPNLEATNVFSESAVASDGVDSLVPPEDTYLIASETRYESESSLPAAQGDAVSYYSSRSFDDYLPSPPPASEFPMSSEHTDSRQIFTLNEADKNDSLRVVPDLVENEGQESSEKNGLEPDLSRKSKANGRNGGKLLRKRSGTRQAVDQPENEGYVGSSSPVGAPGFPVTDEENDSEYQLDGDDNNDNGGDDDFDGGESTDKKKRASKR